MSRTTLKTLVAVLIISSTLVGCARYKSEQGVENLWRDLPQETFQIGRTTQDEIASLLGPPSPHLRCFLNRLNIGGLRKVWNNWSS